MAGDEFFETPEDQSIVKTMLVTNYFQQWKSIMLRHTSGLIAYIDLFCGPGTFADGSHSTPLRVLNDSVKDPELRTRLVTLFNDKNPEYVTRLRAAIAEIPDVATLSHTPQVVNVEVGSRLVDELRGTTLVPSLFFIDPWGYRGLSLDLIGSTIKSWGCDCIFFFNYNRINPGINNPFVVERMNDLFGAARADQLRTQVRDLRPKERRDLIISELILALRDVGGRFVLPFEVQSQHGERTSHYIIFVSKHFLGYHLMKEVMFGLSSDDSEVRRFEYVPVRSPQLRLLLDFDRPYSIPVLMHLLMTVCAGQVLEVRSGVYENHTVDTPYMLHHVKEAIRALEREGRVTIDVPSARRPKQKGQITLGDRRVVTFPE